MSPTPVRAAVVGSGFGGLAAAIRLQAAGVQTVIFEAQDRAGGRAAVFHQDGFTFDAGPTVITAPESLEELFALAGRRMADYLELLPVRPFYRLLWYDGDHFDYGLDQLGQGYQPGDPRRPRAAAVAVRRSRCRFHGRSRMSRTLGVRRQYAIAPAAAGASAARTGSASASRGASPSIRTARDPPSSPSSRSRPASLWSGA